MSDSCCYVEANVDNLYFVKVKLLTPSYQWTFSDIPIKGSIHKFQKMLFQTCINILIIFVV